ncbi:MAG: hypothetical protein IPH07_08520 [Deltaproteobacteria bacterium]|nr:hypothetical protein [Deltaproteobacteria bacterium]
MRRSSCAASGSWTEFAACPDGCDLQTEAWLEDGRDAAYWYMEHWWDGDGFDYADALAVMSTESGIAEATAAEQLGALEGSK